MNHKAKSPAFLLAIGAVLLVLALFSLGRAVQVAFMSSSGGVDFHSYWYSGIFVRQQNDPYAAFLARQEPAFPVSFVGGETVQTLQRGHGKAIIPANTAPLLLLLSPLSLLNWSLAWLLWFLLNLLLILILPWLLVRLIPMAYRPGLTTMLLATLAFLAMKGTRAALATGQTTVLVFVLMILCILLWDQHPVIAGLLLGVALSKYSIALPVFLFALYQRRFRVVLVSVAVQLLGIVAIYAISGSSPNSIVAGYWRIMQLHVDLPGVHLATLFPPDSPLRMVAPVALAVVVVGMCTWIVLRARSTGYFRDLHVLVILTLLTLLIAYHRAYDGILATLYFVLLIYGLGYTQGWQLSATQRRLLIGLSAAGLALLIVPYEQVGDFFPNAFTSTLIAGLSAGAVISLVTLLLATVWLLGHAANVENHEPAPGAY